MKTLAHIQIPCYIFFMDTSLHTTIKTSLMRHYLMRGSILAIIGALILLTAGSLLPPKILAPWGFFLFIAALSLITYGLLPYSRLRRLELNPYQLVIEDEYLDLWRKKKLLMSIPKDNIFRISYMEKKHVYGMLFILKRPLSQRMILLNKLGFFPHCQITPEGNIFLLYFNERAYKEISNCSESP